MATRKAGKGRAVFTISGLGRAQRALNALPDRVQKKVIRQSIRKALRPVKAAIEREAPLGETSQIRDNVKIRATKSRKRGQIALQARIGAGDFVDDTFYAAMVEFGHAIRKVRRGEEVGRVAPDPFMERAFDQTKKPARDMAIGLIKRGIARETQALRNKGGA